MNKNLKFYLFAAAAAALALLLVFGIRYADLSKQMRTVQQQLIEATSEREAVVAEKQPLYDDLKNKKTELNRTSQSLAELTEKKEELRQDIEQLQKDIEALKSSGK